jgi:rhodanese-related sulfurtransferase
MKNISVVRLKEILAQESQNVDTDFINVCTTQEYNENHIKGVRSVPLDTLPLHLSEFTNKKVIYIHCRSGMRSAQAISTLTSLGITAELINVDGGILAWNDAGFDTESHTP